MKNPETPFFQLHVGEGLETCIAFVESGGKYHQACIALGWRWGADGKSPEECDAVAKQLHETFSDRDTLNESLRTCREFHAKGVAWAKNQQQQQQKKSGTSATREDWRASAQEFLNSEPDPIPWIVDDFMAAGCTILAGPQKSGKSVLALSIAIAIGSGQRVLDRYTSRQGHVLYIDAENARELQHDRFRRAVGEDVPERLDIDFQGGCPLLGEGFEGWLVAYLEATPTVAVVVDTREAISSEDEGGGTLTKRQYHELKPLNDLGHKYGVAIIVLDHTSQEEKRYGPDNVSGTRGRTAAVDTVLTLGFIDDESCTLAGRGRYGIVKPMLLKHDAEKLGWVIAGEVEDFEEQKPQKREMSKANKDMLAFIGEHPWLTMKEIVSTYGGKYSATSQRVLRLFWDGHIIRDGDKDGRYAIATATPVSTTDDAFNTPRERGEASSANTDDAEAVGLADVETSALLSPDVVVERNQGDGESTSTTTSSTPSTELLLNSLPDASQAAVDAAQEEIRNAQVLARIAAEFDVPDFYDDSAVAGAVRVFEGLPRKAAEARKEVLQFGWAERMRAELQE